MEQEHKQLRGGKGMGTYLTRDSADPIASGMAVIALWETSSDLSIGSLSK